MIDLPKFKIGELEINLIQGGMGVGISLSGLASAVANCGGAGIISSVGLGLLKYSKNSVEYNKRALREEIRNARKMSKGVIGVNIMHAVTDYKDLVKVAVDEEIDLIIVGAGIPKDLPNLVKDKSISLVPIVSSERLAEIITKAWKRQGKIPDAFIVEGPKAGGHLGFEYEGLINNNSPKLEDIAKEVINFANSFDNHIPVIVAGGIYTGQDIAYYKNLGTAGVQMATRFVTTKECDAHDKFKQAYLNAKKKDLVIIKSPVGMPGRAIMNSFLEDVIKGKKKKFNCKYQCLKTCDPKKSLYCIAEALINAHQGNLDEGFAFAGSNAYLCTPETCLNKDRNFISVKTLMQRLSDEYKTCLNEDGSFISVKLMQNLSGKHNSSLKLNIK